MYVHDPLADPKDALEEYGISLYEWSALPENVDAIIAAASHSEYLSMPISELIAPLKSKGTFVDIKSVEL